MNDVSASPARCFYRKTSTASVDSAVHFRCNEGANGAAAACVDHQYEVIPALSWHRCVIDHLHR